MSASFFNQHLFAIGREVLRFQAGTEWLLKSYFQKHPNLGKSERTKISDSIYTLLRQYEKINRYLRETEQNTPENALLLAAALAHPDKGEEEGKTLVRGFRDFYEAHPLSLEEEAELPAWLTQALEPYYAADKIARLGKSLNQPSSLDLRVNTLKSKRDELLQKLRESGIEGGKTPYSPWGIRLKEKINIKATPFYRDGLFDIQDEGSQLIAWATGAKPQQIVVDFCAGTGGKTLALANMMRNMGSLYALDVAASRLGQLKEREAARGISIVYPVLLENEEDPKLARLNGKCDVVLVDAPCSGLGTLRRQPDLKYRGSPEEIRSLSEKQASILAAASRLCAFGGRLVYATCSILPAENEEVVENFLEANPNFSPANCQKLLSRIKIAATGRWIELNPLATDTDGFFIAVMTKSKR